MDTPNPEQVDEFEAKQRRRRVENFAVEILPTRYPEFPGECDVRMTHNSKQWYTWSLTPDEMRQLIAAMQAALGDAPISANHPPDLDTTLRYARERENRRT